MQHLKDHAYTVSPGKAQHTKNVCLRKYYGSIKPSGGQNQTLHFKDLAYTVSKKKKEKKSDINHFASNGQTA